MIQEVFEDNFGDVFFSCFFFFFHETYVVDIRSNFNGLNTYGTMKISETEVVRANEG